ncbi:glycosyltransferase [Lacticaseibacillus paracasei]|uniref:glycosyltransferase n=1 Tax=Lacticaseibacillus paracasei TaxID=1597 RepID=UPI001C455825|nr:glycosyltransferase [Lacticaseibacillus paracasei]QXJ68264.1 glycosyl transferase [Lacticaseibacillus paracasei subsp. paracasei]
MSENAVLFTVTGGHVQLTGTAIASLCTHWPVETPLRILVMLDQYLEQDIIWLKSIPKQFLRPNVNVDVWEKPPIMDQVHPVYESERYPSVVLWRLFAPYMFSDTDRLLYLDNDILICDNILPLFDQLSDDKTLGAVNDFQSLLYVGAKEGSVWPEVKHFCSYFNSGVLLINTAKYINTYTQDQLVEIINSVNYEFLDQTILNNIFEGQITYLPLQYNYQKDDEWLNGPAASQNSEQAAKIKEAREKVVIRHFVSDHQKLPWEHGYLQDEFERKFWQTFNLVKMQKS